MVGVKVGDEHGLQAPEIEVCVNERRWCPATAVDNKNAVADNER